MKKGQWPGNPECSFCKEVETANHLFFSCPVARSVWGVFGMAVNAICIPVNL